MKNNYTFNINGFEVNATYSSRSVESIFLPLLKKWTDMQKARGKRIIIFLSAPPATGKTTLAHFLEMLSRTHEGITQIQALGLDGFHYHQRYIETHSVTVDGVSVPMRKIKGAPETFDVRAFKEKLTRLRREDVLWPIYDRRLHDVVEDAVRVSESILLIEGNWLLFDCGEWSELKAYCDDSIFISAEPRVLEERLVDRKILGGMSRDDAECFCRESDLKNVRLLSDHRHDANIELYMDEKGEYFIK